MTTHIYKATCKYIFSGLMQAVSVNIFFSFIKLFFSLTDEKCQRVLMSTTSNQYFYLNLTQNLSISYTI